MVLVVQTKRKMMRRKEGGLRIKRRLLQRSFLIALEVLKENVLKKENESRMKMKTKMKMVSMKIKMMYAETLEEKWMNGVSLER